MSTNLKKFENTADYTDYIGQSDVLLPNVSYTIDNHHVYFTQKTAFTPIQGIST